MRTKIGEVIRDLKTDKFFAGFHNGRFDWTANRACAEVRGRKSVNGILLNMTRQGFKVVAEESFIGE